MESYTKSSFFDLANKFLLRVETHKQFSFTKRSFPSPSCFFPPAFRLVARRIIAPGTSLTLDAEAQNY